MKHYLVHPSRREAACGKCDRTFAPHPAYEVPCPHCGKPAGEGCVLSGGGPYPTPHAARSRAAEHLVPDDCPGWPVDASSGVRQEPLQLALDEMVITITNSEAFDNMTDLRLVEILHDAREKAVAAYVAAMTANDG